MGGTVGWLRIQPPEDWEQLCPLKAYFKKTLLIHVSPRKRSLPVLPGIDLHVAPVPVAGVLAVNTHRQPEASLGLCGPGPARLLVWTCELNYSAALWKRCWLVLEIPDQAPGPAGFVNTSCGGRREPVPSLAVCLRQFGENHCRHWSSLCFSSCSRLLGQSLMSTGGIGRL